jgi:hypothetical protein
VTEARRAGRRATSIGAALAVAALVPGLALAQAPSAPVGPAGPAPAASPDKAACVRALDDAQRLRSQKKLTQARAELVTCASEGCPQVVREDCARSLLEVDGALPTVVLSATGDGGADVTDARVSIDGVQVLDKLDGRARAVDPGTHVFKFERPGHEYSVTLLILEGEKNRQVVAKLGAPPPASSSSAPPPAASGALAPTPPPVAGEERAPLPIVPIVLAGVGAGALGSALYFRLRADGDADDLRASCAPACDASQRDALSEKLVIANVSLGIGLGAIAAAAVTWVLSSRWR